MNQCLAVTHRQAARVAIALAALSAGGALASSHREAPFVTQHPKVDATDFYMFRSYEPGRENFVTIVANYQPFQSEYGGPNFFQMDPDALYEIEIDNNGDASEDLTFQFRFTNVLKDLALDIGPAGNTKHLSVPVYNLGVITPGDSSTLNITESYTLTLVRGDRRSGAKQVIANADTGAVSFEKPADRIGDKSIPNYPAYAAAHIFNIRLPGTDTPGRVFVGQRKDPFRVNLGEAFDLVNISNVLGPTNVEENSLEENNVTSLILELPIAFLTANGNPTIGGWTTASVRQARVLNPNPTFFIPAINGGAFVQVSRLGMPLVNELVVGVKDKNKFNSSIPKDDAQFLDYVTNPTFPAIIEILFGNAGVRAPTLFPRTDLISVFLTGIDGLNKTATPSEMLRLNTSIAPTPKDQQKFLGVLAGDNAGFPNGRRPGDDVVDAALRVVMGVLLPTDQAPSGQLPFTDGTACDATFFDNAFPYLTTPVASSPNGTP